MVLRLALIIDKWRAAYTKHLFPYLYRTCISQRELTENALCLSSLYNAPLESVCSLPQQPDGLDAHFRAQLQQQVTALCVTSRRLVGIVGILCHRFYCTYCTYCTVILTFLTLTDPHYTLHIIRTGVRLHVAAAGGGHRADV
jgi:hypothetical protein